MVFYFICKANSNNYHILMIDIIICFSHRNVSFFLVIIGIYLRHPPYFNLVFTLIFTYPSMGTLMEISTLSYLPTYLPTFHRQTDRHLLVIIIWFCFTFIEEKLLKCEKVYKYCIQECREGQSVD